MLRARASGTLSYRDLLTPTLRLSACAGFLRDVAWSRQKKRASFALDFATLLRVSPSGASSE